MRGIGIRYTSTGIRALEVRGEERTYHIEKIASGYPDSGITTFLLENGFDLEGAEIAVGLAPGDFLSSSMTRENGMVDAAMEDHLQWEIERKMISPASGYVFDAFIDGYAGFGFAARRGMVQSIRRMFGAAYVDTEPVALLNGCELSGAMDRLATVMISCVEGEGISSIVARNGTAHIMEAFPIDEDALSAALSGLDVDKMNELEPETTERLTGYIIDSINRLTSFGGDNKKLTPQKLILAGGGVYIGNLLEKLQKESPMPPIVTEPLAPWKEILEKDTPELTGMGAAFTSCLGLALRAIEE